MAPPPGVETFLVDTGHLAAGETAVYPQTPPVGGRHDPVWQRCGFYDGPVPTERAVHSLEHGVTWITFRPDLAESEKELLAELAHANPDVLVSRWDRAGADRRLFLGPPAEARLGPHPQLMQFILAFSGKAPEPLGSCS